MALQQLRSPRQPSSLGSVLSEAEWRSEIVAHRDRVEPVVNAHLERRACGHKHPIYDFLFEYYPFRASHLLRWHPGPMVVLAGGQEYLARREYYEVNGGVTLDRERFPGQRLAGLQLTIDLLLATRDRAPNFGCFGLHEWAMMYRAEEMRHEALNLRLSAAEVASVVENSRIACSHFDAFRFFTPQAKPLNLLQPSAERREDWEQPGCIHANMDLYRHAAKFAPWIRSKITADAFLLAVAAREVDMRASPYDLSALGFAPICIETPEGRDEYQRAQKEIAELAQEVRAALLEELEDLLNWVTPQS